MDTDIKNNGRKKKNKTKSRRVQKLQEAVLL